MPNDFLVKFAYRYNRAIAHENRNDEKFRIMRFLKNPNATIAILAIYTAIMYIYLFPRNNEMSSNEKWSIVAVSVVVLALLWVLLRRRSRLRKEREKDIENNKRL